MQSEKSSAATPILQQRLKQDWQLKTAATPAATASLAATATRTTTKSKNNGTRTATATAAAQ